MEVIVINKVEKEIKDLFLRYVPDEFEHYMNDGAILLGAVDTDDSLFEPIGLTILVMEENQFVIKWMWIDPDKRFNDGGCRMLEECFNITNDCNLKKLYAHVPALDAEAIGDSDIAGFFYENGFQYLQDADTQEGRVFVLSADVDTAVSLGNDEENRRIAQARISKGYKNFPNKFTVTEVEYYSGVPIDEV